MYMYIVNSPLTLNMLALDAIPGTEIDMQCYFKINYRRSSEVSHAKLVQRFAPLNWRQYLGQSIRQLVFRMAIAKSQAVLLF